VTVAILAADHQAPWPEHRGRLVVRSDRDEAMTRVGDGAGRVAATREGGRWSGPDVAAGRGYFIRDQSPDPPKTPAQIRRDIDDLTRSRKPRSRVHSEKALTTLAMMGTLPSQWRLTPIEWIEEEREVPGLVRCPVCRGRKFVRFEGGQVVPPPPANTPASFEYDQAAHRESSAARRPYGNCPRCEKPKSGWGMIPQGKVAGAVRARVMVGYPKFPPGTRFDSRFQGGLHCNLCNKLILRSNRVPVHAMGDDGVAHGMFVGEDCARKFLDVDIVRREGSIMESGNAPRSAVE
jgi:hypothetical protein